MSDINNERGIHYANGGIADEAIYYPNPERIQQYHDEWENYAHNMPSAARTAPTVLMAHLAAAKEDILRNMYDESPLLAFLKKKKR